MPQVWGRVAGKLSAGKDEDAAAIRTEKEEILVLGACFSTILYRPKLILSSSLLPFPIKVIPYAFCNLSPSQNLFHCPSEVQGRNKSLDFACASVFVIA